MNSQERIKTILSGQPADRVGFWPGLPTQETHCLYCQELGIKLPEEINPKTMLIEDQIALQIEWDKTYVDLAIALGSDIFWCSPANNPYYWRHPEGLPFVNAKTANGKERIFANTTDVQEVLDFEWPNLDYLDFSVVIKQIDYAKSKKMAIIGGMPMPFFHELADYFGMEPYFIKMYTNPEVVLAATQKILETDINASKRFLDVARDKIDGGLFFNDFGTQIDLLVSPENFDQFIMPGFKQIINHLKSYDLKVILHSCGAINKVIPKLIDAGIDALHPLQANAADMQAELLAERYTGQVAFFGGVDTQDLLPFHSPQEVTADVKRLKNVFGKRFILSPSHEAILENVPLENMLAMKDEALR